MKLKACFITGSRAEYGLLYPLIKRLKLDNNFKVQIIATGMHLMNDFGNTYRIIEKDFGIDKKVDIAFTGDGNIDVAKATGNGIIGFTSAFKELKPDFIVLLGDRYEIFATAICAYLMRIPIVHIHGGEITEGAIDDGIRHSITKMSQLHFTSTEEYRKRVIQLGEESQRVFNVGALGVENIKTMELLPKSELEKQINFALNTEYVLVTFHSETMEKDGGINQLQNLLKVLNKVKYKVIFTKPNSDAHGKIIIQIIERFVRKNPGRVALYSSMGQLKYLSTIKYASVVIGNSSSGIIEAPSLKVPTVNIGGRQKGRIRAASVIDVNSDIKSISAGIKKAFSTAFKKECLKISNPYGKGNTSGQILSILKKNKTLITQNTKSFYDLWR